MQRMDDTLRALEAADQLRSLRVVPGSGGAFFEAGRRVLNFASNDYLGLARHPRLVEAGMAALRQWGCGATASRLICGHLACHAELEADLADWMRTEAALVFGSGYLTNLGLLSSLAGRRGRVFADRLNHASLVDGLRITGTKVQRYRHADWEDLARRLECAGGADLIVTDAVFSMDGDCAPLRAIEGLARRHGAGLIVDEAHALGVLGPTGCGQCEALGLPPEAALRVGTLSKALGGYGGFVACDGRTRDYLVNHARSLIYSTGLSPVCVAAAREAIALIREAAGAMGVELMRRAHWFAKALRANGCPAGEPSSPIIPVVLGSNRRAVMVSKGLERHGIWAPPIRPPTVPVGTARLRLSITLDHSESDLERAAEVIGRVLKRDVEGI